MRDISYLSRRMTNDTCFTGRYRTYGLVLQTGVAFVGAGDGERKRRSRGKRCRVPKSKRVSFVCSDAYDARHDVTIIERCCADFLFRHASGMLRQIDCPRIGPICDSLRLRRLTLSHATTF